MSTADWPLDILILHFNRPDLLSTTLEAVGRAAARDTSGGAVRVWILDNGSDEASRAAARRVVDSVVRNVLPDVHWIESPENLGFARGMNLLWRSAKPRGWVLSLNSDTGIADDFLAGARKCLPGPDTKSFASPIIEELGTRYSGGRVDLWRAIARMAPATQPCAEFASGSALLVPAPPLPKDGPWNEAFFFYGEDVELCVRLRQQGWKLELLPLVVRHAGRGSIDRVRSIELHFRGRGTLVRELPISNLRHMLIRVVVSAEVVLRSAVWALIGKAELARAAWRGWFG